MDNIIMNFSSPTKSMRILALSFLLLTCLPLQASEKAQELFEEAMVLIKADHRANSKKSIILLKQAQGELMKIGELSEEQEALLVKINTNIYWQAKLGGLKDSAPINAPVRKTGSDKGPGKVERKEALGAMRLGDGLLKKQKEEWNKKKEEKAGEFEQELKNAEAYEKSHQRDSMSNMLNYLDLQTKVLDLEQAEALMEKAKQYNKEIESSRQATIDRGMANLRNYQDLLKKKSYLDIFEYIKLQFRHNKVSPKDYDIFKLYGMEMKAMAKLKKTLLSLDRTKAIPLPRIPHQMPANVLKINDDGLQIKYEDGEQGFMGWNTVSEKILLEMATSLIDTDDRSNIFTLALSHLRLNNFDEAYGILHQLVENSGENFIKYKDFLAMCEMGYRLKNGPRFEEIFQEANQNASKGKQDKALNSLKDFKKDYLSSLLGRSYLNRFKVLYYDILRS